MKKTGDILNKKWFFTLIYTILFIFTALLVYRLFIKDGRTLIWRKDGWEQHVRALRYYKDYMKMVCSTIFTEGRFTFPNYSFELGYGSDVFTTFSYYMFGDPISFLAVFSPEAYISYVYDFLILLRIYLAGFVFAQFCFYTGKTDFKGIWAGSISYAFCGFAFLVIRHPFFVNPMIYLPLLLIGVESVIQKRKNYIMLLAAFFGIMSNYYFFFMEVLFVIIYVAVRLGFMLADKRVKETFQSLVQIAINSFLGVCLSAVVLVPVAMTLISDKRASLKFLIPLFYEPYVYKSMLKGFVSYNDSGLYYILGYTVLALFSLYLLFREKKTNKILKTLFIILTIIMILPYAAHVFNGFSYVCGRLIFGYSMLMAYIIADMWPCLMKSDKKRGMELFGVLALFYLLLVILKIELNFNLIWSLSFGLIFVVGLLLREEKLWLKNVFPYLSLAIIIASIGINADNAYSLKGAGHIATFEKRANMPKLEKNESQAIKQVKDDSFFRISAPNIQRNTTLGTGVYGIQYFWSTSNFHVWDYLSLMGNRDNIAVHIYEGADDRTIMNLLGGVKYFASKPFFEKTYVPKTYEAAYEFDGYNIFESDKYLPFGFVYDSYITRDELLKLTQEQREQALLQTAVLENECDELKKGRYSFDSTDIPYSIIPNENVKVEEHCFKAAELPDDDPEQEACIYLKAEDVENAEVYLVIEGLEYVQERSFEGDYELGHNGVKYAESCMDFLIYDESSMVHEDGSFTFEKEKMKKWINLCTDISIYNTGRKDFVINLNYQHEPGGIIKIKFAKLGSYHYDSLRLVKMPLTSVDEWVAERKKDVLTNLDFHMNPYSGTTDTISAQIDASAKELLTLEIPYAKGWTAYVDGNAQELLQTDILYSGLLLNEGHHDIVLKYETPGYKLGLWISVISIFVSLLWLTVSKRYYAKK